MYTWERLRKTEQLIKTAEVVILNSIFSSRQRRMLGVVVWGFKGEEGNSHGNGKANRTSVRVDLARPLPVYRYPELSMVMVCPGDRLLF